MKALHPIRAGVVGAGAVALPGAAYGTALVFTLRGAPQFLGLACVALALVGALAWVCVRFARFSNLLAIVLTTLPFALCTVLTVSALIAGSAAGFLIQALILAVA